MTDAESIIYGILNGNWSATNAAKPHILNPSSDGDAAKQRSLSYPHSIKIYEVDRQYTPRGLGYQGEDMAVRLTVDLQGASRSLILSQVDEVRRCLLLCRKNPGSTLSPADLTFDRLIVQDAVKQSGYYKSYHYTIDCVLKKSAKSI